MTTHTTTAPRTTALRSRRRQRVTAPALAGIAFVMAWIVGLLVWPSNLNIAAPGSRVVSAYAGHQGVAVTQYLLVEGIAAIALAVVVTALGRAASRHGAERAGRVILLAGIGAVTVSLAECALGLILAAGAVPAGDTGRAATLFHLINRLDGVKMLALAILALGAVTLARRGALAPRWLGHVGVALAAAMVASGTGYLLLSNGLAQAAAASLALLLVWVAATGLTVGRVSR
jgi:hypothetical protein